MERFYLMSEDIVISVKNVTKTYRLYNSHADRVKETFNPFRKKYHRPFNALTNISFDVRKGETFGIIGQNGSGKSTLLQIVCGILQPTSGSVEVKGRVSALLELGAGFNPDFTGIENVYLNGSIMGYSNDEMDQKLDDILSFADIGDFVYQPVKTYSSGMYVRLAFSVATIVEPDILIIDEALSVGDMFFQAKCMTRMKNMIDNEGTTLIFVSHDVGAVKSICQKSILLNNGQIFAFGNSEKVVNEYLKNIRTSIDVHLENNNLDRMFEKTENESKEENKPANKIEYIICNRNQGYGSKEAIIDSYRFYDPKIGKTTEFDWGENVTIEIISKFFISANKYSVGFLIRDMYGLDVFGTNLNHEKVIIPDVKSDQSLLVKFNFGLFFQPGTYTLTLAVSRSEQDEGEIICDWHDNLLTFKINKSFPTIPDTKAYIPTKSEVKLIE